MDEDYNIIYLGILRNFFDFWEDFCFFDGSEFKNNIFYYNCYIDDVFSGKWNFIELRKYILLINVYYSFNVKCK